MMWDELLARFAMIWKPLVAGVALLAAAGSTAGYWLHFREPPHELRLPGTVETQDVRLSSRVGGRVAKTFVTESSIVEPGQPIVELDMPELDAQHDQLVAQRKAAEAVLLRLKNGAREEEKAAAKAAVDVAKAKLSRMERGYRDEEVEQARQELQALDAEFQNAQQELNRERSLLAKGASTMQQYDAANARYTKLLAQVSAANAKTKMMESGYRAEEIAESKAEVARLQANYDLLLAGTRSEEIAEAEAKILDLTAKSEEIDVKRKERLVTAPERAVVEVLSVRPGDIVGPNQTVALVLRADDLWVKAYISEIDLGRIRLGQKVKVTCDTYPDKRFEGVVSYIASASEFTPRNVQTVDERRHQVFGFKVRVTDPDGVFKSGMAADVWLPLGKSETRSTKSETSTKAQSANARNN
jgi:HlyD family secretion protein